MPPGGLWGAHSRAGRRRDQGRERKRGSRPSEIIFLPFWLSPSFLLAFNLSPLLLPTPSLEFLEALLCSVIHSFTRASREHLLGAASTSGWVHWARGAQSESVM